MIATLGKGLPALRGKDATDIRIGTHTDIIACLGPLHQADRQMLQVLTLTSAERLIDHHLVSIGSVDTCNMHPREIFRYALYDSAYSIALVLNHPSGDPEPTQDERRIARDLVEVGELLDISVTEFVIVATGGWYSFIDNSENEQEPWDGLPF